MDFDQFKLPFAAAAVVLLIVLGLIARSVLRSRSKDRVDDETARNGTARSKETPATVAEASSAAPQRRRRIVPASVSEAAETAPQVEPEPEPSQTPAESLGFHQEVLARLEQAFDAYQRQEISLSAYRTLVETEEATVVGHADALRARKDRGEIDSESFDQDMAEIQAAHDAVRWCQEWAQDLEDGQAPS